MEHIPRFFWYVISFTLLTLTISVSYVTVRSNDLELRYNNIALKLRTNAQETKATLKKVSEITTSDLDVKRLASKGNSNEYDAAFKLVGKVVVELNEETERLLKENDMIINELGTKSSSW